MAKIAWPALDLSFRSIRPLALLLAVLALKQWGDRLPPWLQRLAERPSWPWDIGIGLIIGLSLLRWLLQR